jgi:hypothetical protein
MFFSVKPEVQEKGEKVFFEAPFFIKSVDNLRLEFSYSFLHKDLMADIFLKGNPKKYSSYSLKEINSINIETDEHGIEWLIASSENGQQLKLTVDPQISISVTKVSGPN